MLPEGCFWKNNGDFEPMLSERVKRHIAEETEAGAEAETGPEKPSSQVPTTPVTSGKGWAARPGPAIVDSDSDSHSIPAAS